MVFSPAKRALFLYFLCSVIIASMLFHDLICFDSQTTFVTQMLLRKRTSFFSVEQTYFQIVFVIYEYS